MNILESSTHSSCQVAINEIEHQRALMMDLHDLILPILDTHSGQAKLVQQLFQDIFNSSSKVISFLELGDNSEKQANLIRYKRKHGKNNMESHILEEETKEIGNKRRKNAEHIGSVVTQAPYFDGYQWRKYGQKWISKAKHSRSYYRCANSKGQGCLATKTVQQKETDGSGTVRLFDVDYYGQHICKKDGIIHPYVVETTCHSVPIVNHNQSSISTFVNNDVHGIQDENYENLFMVPDMPECLKDLTDTEMERALELTCMNLPLISEDIWA
ncbi:hypothetical protein SEVIR_8G011600v4 [Setaria viridis]|uniref:WRKY domain-containing protein n=1 Tax=Setaria viridis TaxID=4556 RepID=A0A4U6TAK8_SETVI|nr:probable WRKY transcription factor 62 isoform X1 [Setaria viridis]XP_034569149.1 probable WRKY transcription factor 62 isoform X1 [Setaria viridis]TKV99010.1 hypothetical protein SEVIR_8G011600v2 [Setaria viridis]